MRRLLPPALARLVAACASTPAPKPAAVVVTPTTRPGGTLIGLDVHDLGRRFGQPAFQVREGAGIKLQFRGACVLDAYLYPPEDGRGPERVTHVDTRLASGADTDQANCIRALAGA